jgi:putative transposase
LRDENGLVLEPELATGDGALGFWQALHQVWPKTRQQRCWVHKTANILNALPKSVHGKAKQDLHAIYEAENRKAAGDAFDRFLAKYGAKYDKATAACLSKDRQALLAFYDFPAEEHWKHVRTSNPIESTFATHRPSQDRQDQGLLVTADRPGDGLQARQVGRASLAPAGRTARSASPR